MNNHHCADRDAMESYPQYAQRVLGYALTYGIEPLTLSQLEVADRYAQQIVTSQPGTHEPHHAYLDEILHTLRLRLAARMAAKRQQLAGLQRLIDQAYQESETVANLTGGDQGDAAPASEQEQAIRLLRAALMMIMQPPTNGDGGKGARLIRPVPKLPNGGIALQQPAAPPAARSRF